MKNRSGFSLIEVTLAIGIVSFALLSVVALLPTGLKSVKNANEQAGAAHVLNSLAGAVLQARQAPSTPGRFFGGPVGESRLLYELSGSDVTHAWDNLRLDGHEESSAQPRRLAARLMITPPTTNASGAILTAGRATISVAWSAQASPRWNTANRTWQGADGSMTTALLFQPER